MGSLDACTSEVLDWVAAGIDCGCTALSSPSDFGFSSSTKSDSDDIGGSSVVSFISTLD